MEIVKSILISLLSGGLGGLFFPFFHKWIQEKPLKIEPPQEVHEEHIYLVNIQNPNDHRAAIFNCNVNAMENGIENNELKYKIKNADSNISLGYNTFIEPHARLSIRIEGERSQWLTERYYKPISIYFSFNSNINSARFSKNYSYNINLPITRYK